MIHGQKNIKRVHSPQATDRLQCT